MREYRPGEAARLAGVSVDSIRRWCDEGRLRTRRVDSKRFIDGADLARFLLENGSTLHAADLGLGGSSARNRLTGIVTAVERDKVAARIEMQCGPYRLVALMTSEAVDELGLQPGDLAVASVKSTNVVVEVPR